MDKVMIFKTSITFMVGQTFMANIFYCDDYCIEMYLDNTLLNYNELNFDITIYNNFQKINFTANPGQKLTIVIKNVIPNNLGK